MCGAGGTGSWGSGGEGGGGGGTLTTAALHTPAAPAQKQSLNKSISDQIDLRQKDPAKALAGVVEHGPGRYGGEAFFVPDPSRRGEDAGFLVSYVHDEGEGRSELVVYDAQRLPAPPVARVALPARVPFGFHVHHVPEAELAAIMAAGGSGPAAEAAAAAAVVAEE